jgi:hypothetical protein
LKEKTQYLYFKDGDYKNAELYSLLESRKIQLPKTINRDAVISLLLGYTPASFITYIMILKVSDTISDAKYQALLSSMVEELTPQIEAAKEYITKYGARYNN